MEDDALSGKLAAGVSRHNADFGAFRQRLAAAGKPKIVVRIALAHKLLVRLNAKARDVLQQLREAPPAAVCFLKYPSRRSVGGKWQTQPRFPSGLRPHLFHNHTNPHTLDKTDSRSPAGCSRRTRAMLMTGSPVMTPPHPSLAPVGPRSVPCATFRPPLRDLRWMELQLAAVREVRG